MMDNLGRNSRRWLQLLLMILLTGIFFSCSRTGEPGIRREQLLNADWFTVADDSSSAAFTGFQQPDFVVDGWQQVDVPHNWDDYGGYRRLRHGNRHGYAWYRKTFSVEQPRPDKQYFLWFEGVGSYATVWLNGDSVGYHAGGRTSFTLDVTDFIQPESENLLAVRADHPADIRDLPWVCGGCSPEWGFSEGSQPLGIFRPVHLITTDPVRIEPFGVHIWNDENISEKEAALHLTTEVKNYRQREVSIRVVNSLKDNKGKVVTRDEEEIRLAAGQMDTIRQTFDPVKNPRLWSLEDPYLYTVHTELFENGQLVDELKTPCGIRWIKWDIFGEDPTNRFYLNGKPVFINGTAEYEHLTGQSHAFSDEQVLARVEQVLTAGYNSFRDAHQPHNLRYHPEWDRHGILWWPQMAAHIWFDNPDFRQNFKQLLTDWIRERRNSPSIILWGLENESTLPADFAEECSDLIRKLDPTASKQRLITTCNGGTGTDWNVIQNWSGTYGGNPDLYAEEISSQLLNGEYGAWRSAGLHTEGEFDQNGLYSEDRFNLLMESKIRLAESVSDLCCGQYHWLFSSHENPGRTQGGEGVRGLDRLGPVNYKGIMTIWGEPLDAWYMYRANYAPKQTEPMVYIVSHSWPDRWLEPGVKNGIRVFSNCEEVELFNGVKSRSFGRKSNPGRGRHFIWNEVDVQTNVLYAEGYVNGKKMAEDYIVLHHLPVAEGIEKLAEKVEPLTSGADRNYLYRVNCGGPDYVDTDGHTWMADVRKSDEKSWGSRSWTDDYDGLPAFYGSQRQSYDPVQGTLDWRLLQSYRYGRHKLSYEFPVPDGEYQVELFFTEPWYGKGGGLDCSGWRLFDVAVNDEVMLKKLDIWSEAGVGRMLKKMLHAKVTGGKLKISFPKVDAGQAVISAIAVSTAGKTVKPAPASERLLSGDAPDLFAAKTWLNTGDKCFADAEACFAALPSELYGAEWLQPATENGFSPDRLKSLKITADADLYFALKDSVEARDGFKYHPEYVKINQNSGTIWHIYRKRFSAGEAIQFPNAGSGLMMLAAVPVTKLDDAIDLRETVTYRVEDATLAGKSRKTELAGKEGILLSGKNDAVSWQFSVGLASKYGLEIRYLNPAEKSLMVEMSIVSRDGRVMWQGPLEFLPSGGKLKSLRTDTQTTINAGTYTIRFKLLDGGPIGFNFLKIQ
ncbi:malectin domain-containing carbohydrate-binding protein [Gaoshiqia sp. Z1-71]|uniref:malectin domain-containing carbohydrate-binding protein n=1 Tax=Gaoshiqia hydrogeniformans TaxID=3290090 RepID=UPI003BF8D434